MNPEIVTKIKIAEAPEQVIDFLVAKCEGEKYGPPTFRVHQNSKGATVYLNAGMQQSGIPYRPSADWAQGGPITEREGISTVFQGDGHEWVASLWDYETEDWRLHTTGPTPLIAAMRCYCYAKLGEYVDIPEELCQ